MQSEGILRLVIWPAWFLLLCSVVLLVAGFARAFAGEFRRHGSRSEDDDRGAPEQSTSS
ncbi:MAG TPA: hypothetical protein VE994_01355 [Terriglobales bacterium]|nr:hypothetical protein [Terriglobales bacterium]